MAKRELVGTPTKEKTKAGRTVYRTKEGERVSEKSATVGPIKGKYYNVPSIHAGKRYTDDELVEAIKNNRLIPTSVHDSIPEAEAAAKKRSNKLNKGGAMLNQQMKMAFMEEGGLQDEGGTVDKESGNDVPSGSLKKEVRDDVPAMLSEGEFVFPADVVRYIGLNKLMQMRQEAKMGLQMMEKMGQMGNSEEAEIPDDLPFGVTDIVVMGNDDDDDDEKGMAQGGVIYAQEGTAVPPQVDKYGNPKPVALGVNYELVDGEWVKSGAVLRDAIKIPPQQPQQTDFEKMMGEENTDVSKGVGAVLLPDGTIDNSAMMDMYNRGQQPQQTDFEKMMGYGAGQGSNPYGARRIPYTKADGSTVNILEDYMGRPMESIEGLTRSTPYQAGPIMGGNTPAGGGGVTPIQPVLPPMPVDPTDDTAERRDRDAFYGKGSDSTGRLTSMAEAKKQGKKLGDFSDAYEAQQARLDDPTRTGNLLEDLKLAGKDLITKPKLMKEDLINQLKAIPEEFRKSPDVLKAIGEEFNMAKRLGVDRIKGGYKKEQKERKDRKDKFKKASEGGSKVTVKSSGDSAADKRRQKEVDKKDKEVKDRLKEASKTGSLRLKKGGLMKKDYP